MSRLRPLAPVAAILLLAGAMRFRAMGDLGLFLWDDAVVTLEARWLAAGAEAAAESLERRRIEKRTGEDVWKAGVEVEGIRRVADREGVAPRFGRPLHEALLAAVLFLSKQRTGEWADWAAAWISAIAGTASVYLIYVLGTLLYGRRAGRVAAALLAVSGYHVMYSREGFTESILVSFQLLALLAYVRARRMPPERPWGGLVLLGLVCGLGITAHLRFVLVPGILTLYEIAHWLRFRRHAAGVEAKRLALVWGATLAPPLLCELPYYALFLATNRLGVHVHAMTYIEQLALVLRSTGLGYAGSLVRFRFQNLLTFPYALLQYEGFVKTALVAVGVGLAVRRRTLGDGLALAFLAGVTLYYSATIPLLRYASLAIPIASLLAARGLAEDPAAGGAARGGRVGHELATFAILLAFVEGSARTLTVVETDSGYSAAVESIDSPHVSTMFPVSQAYAGVDRVKPVPATVDELEALRAAGYRRLLVDNLENYLVYQGMGFPGQEALLRGIEGACSPARVVPNPFGGSLQFALELNYRPIIETLAVKNRANTLGSAEIRIYDLDECLPNVRGKDGAG